MVFIKDASFTKELANQIFVDCNKLTNNKPYFLITLMLVKLIPTADVYDFYASEEREVIIKKQCFILNSSVLRLAANFYFKVKKQTIPSKVFSNEFEGINWLMEKIVENKKILQLL